MPSVFARVIKDNFRGQKMGELCVSEEVELCFRLKVVSPSTISYFLQKHSFFFFLKKKISSVSTSVILLNSSGKKKDNSYSFFMFRNILFFYTSFYHRLHCVHFLFFFYNFASTHNLFIKVYKTTNQLDFFFMAA